MNKKGFSAVTAEELYAVNGGAINQNNQTADGGGTGSHWGQKIVYDNSKTLKEITQPVTDAVVGTVKEHGVEMVTAIIQLATGDVKGAAVTAGTAIFKEATDDD